MASTLDVQDQFLEGKVNPYVYQLSLRELGAVAGLGACIGLLTPFLGELISRYFIEPFFCRSSSSFAFCGEGGSLAFGIALVILSIAALLVLASLRTYQPLLNAVAAFSSLWGLDRYLQTLSSDHRLEYYLFVAGLFAFAYALFYLLLRIRILWISLALVVAAVVLIRLQF